MTRPSRCQRCLAQSPTLAWKEPMVMQFSLAAGVSLTTGKLVPHSPPVCLEVQHPPRHRETWRQGQGSYRSQESQHEQYSCRLEGWAGCAATAEPARHIISQIIKNLKKQTTAFKRLPFLLKIVVIAFCNNS